MTGRSKYYLLLRLVDTRSAGAGFPDMLEAIHPRADRLAELGLGEPTAREFAELRQLRDALRFVVLDSAPDLPVTEVLNSLLRDYAVIPQLTEALDLRFVAARDDRVAALAEHVLPQAVDLLCSGDLQRLQICSAHDCAAPFVASPAPRARTYCSARCSTRVRVRKFRASAASRSGAAR